MAQSVLNFTPKGPAGIAVTNTTATAADVKFTLYKSDGTLATTPNSYQVQPNGQLAMMASDIFAVLKDGSIGGWIQATSAVPGLQGFYFSGDFVSTFGGAETPLALPVQTIPYLSAISNAPTTVLITNPGGQAVDVSVSFFAKTGALAGDVVIRRFAPHEQVSLAGNGASVRIAVTSPTPGAGVLATAVTQSNNALIVINGQAPDKRGSRQLIPYFENRRSISFLISQPQDFKSTLVLANPWNEDVTATVSFFTVAGVRRYGHPVPISANGSKLVDWNEISENPIPPAGSGWILVDSPLALAGVALVDSGVTVTAIPLQSSPSTRILLSRASARGWTSHLTFVGDAERDANLTVTLNKMDGTTAAVNTLKLPALTQVSRPLIDLIPDGARFESGFVTIRSNVPVYVMELLGLADGSGQTAVTPQLLSPLFAPGPIINTPRISAQMVDAQVVPRARFRISAGSPLADNPTLWVGNQQVATEISGPFNREFSALLPDTLEPGSITVRVRTGGVDSDPLPLGIYSPDESIGADSQFIFGYAHFQKVEVTDNGLDTSLTVRVPIRYARVEVVDNLGAIFSVDQTDAMGRFSIPAPNRGGLKIRVTSQLRSQDIKVLNNSANNALYVISGDIDGSETTSIDLVDTSRNAGAFNILDNLVKGNGFIQNAVPGLVPPALAVYWSEKNDAATLAKLTNGAIRTTFFNPSTTPASAYILGDRATDSDEFDDAVILHEYAHLLAAKFSKDDSNGGPHLLGDLLDPRIAWSEGWADFFSSAVRGSPIYRDSKAQNAVLRFDIEENLPVGDHPGYSSEASVDGLLWDLLDENADKDDTLQFPFSAIWNAFTDLKNDRNVYLPYFLEHFLQRNATNNPSLVDALRTMVIARSIDFQPDVRPSVTNPFPRSITVGGFQEGQLDSLTTKRTNLLSSSHFFSLSAATSGQFLIKLAITNLGPANNPSANDLDLFLYDSTGKRIIAQSDSPSNGGGEIISATLSPGNYFIEIRSFYIREQTNSTVFNSGGYRLSVDKLGP